MSFDLTSRQRELRTRSRGFARDVLRDIKATSESLPTPEERFIATRPAYEKLVADGFLRACLPVSVGGDQQSLIDTAIVTEEFYAENPSIALTLVGTVLGVAPIVVGGTAEQQSRLLAPFLAYGRSAAGRVLLHRTRGQRERRLAATRRGSAHPRRPRR